MIWWDTTFKDISINWFVSKWDLSMFLRYILSKLFLWCRLFSYLLYLGDIWGFVCSIDLLHGTFTLSIASYRFRESWMFPSLLSNLRCAQINGFIMAWISYSFTCTLYSCYHHYALKDIAGSIVVVWRKVCPILNVQSGRLTCYKYHVIWNILAFTLYDMIANLDVYTSVVLSLENIIPTTKWWWHC